MTRCTSVLLDFDGTLFDTRPAIAATLHATFVDRGASPPPRSDLEAAISRGIGLEAMVTELLPRGACPAQLGEWVATYLRIYDSGIGIRSSAPFPGTRHALEELHASGIPIVIVSNKGEPAIRKTLSYFGMIDFVRLIIGPCDVYPPKPNPRSYFERIVPALGAQACERVLFAGDTEVDLHYARGIGAVACWAAYGYGNRDACQELQPDIVAASPTQIAAAVCTAPDVQRVRPI